MYDEVDQPEAVSIDQRVTLMQQIVEMEQVRDRVHLDGMKLAKQVAELNAQIKEARRELAGRMGWDDDNKPTQAMSRQEAERIKERLADYRGSEA